MAKKTEKKTKPLAKPADAAKPKHSETGAKDNDKPRPVKKVVAATLTTGTGSGSAANRRLKKPRYTSFKLEKRIKYKAPRTPGTIKVFKESLGTIRKNWKVLLGISAVYAVFYLLFVRGIGGGLDFAGLKEEITYSLDGLLGQGEVGNLSTVLGIVGVLLVNPAAGNQVNVAANFYQSVLFVMFTLALIWALRQLQAGQRISVKDAYYKGMYPIVPFILILVVIGLQILPVVVANTIVQTVQDPESPIALTIIEQVIWALFWFLMFVASAYMVSGSVFALIVVTLADMTPVKALRGAYDLVRFRRLAVMRRLFFFIIILLVLMALVMLPALLWAVKFAGIIYALWSVFAITLLVTYIYTMYRRMLPRD